MYTLKLKVYGRVQGVNFRASTRKKARKLNLGGWVKNVPDGTVKIVVYGNKNKLEELKKWVVSGGPPVAKVKTAEEDWGVFNGEVDNSFDIRY